MTLKFCGGALGGGGGGRFLVHCVEVEVRNVGPGGRSVVNSSPRARLATPNRNEPRGLCRNRKPNHRDPGAPKKLKTGLNTTLQRVAEAFLAALVSMR